MEINVMVVDDHPVVRTGLRAFCERQSGITVVGEAASGEEAVTLANHLHPAVILCDLRLGPGIDGVATTAKLRAQTPPPAVIILTTFDLDDQILAAIEAGAAGYLLKDAPPEAIVRGIKDAALGLTVLAPEMANRLVDKMRQPKPKLTNRELEVLRLLEAGVTNREIARSLFVSEATIKTHLVHLFAKLEVDTRTMAVTQARKTGLL